MYPVYGGIDDRTDTTTGTFGAGSRGAPARNVPSATHTYANWAVIAWFLIATVGLVMFDKAGFKFMVKVGRG